MKHNTLLLGAMALLSLLPVSCSYWDEEFYGGSINNTTVWVSARYDSNGFPIYGYYRGRPVYGYCRNGQPIYSFHKLQRDCYVPSWGPSASYHGPWHYPSYVHRSSSCDYHKWHNNSHDSGRKADHRQHDNGRKVGHERKNRREGNRGNNSKPHQRANGPRWRH